MNGTANGTANGGVHGTVNAADPAATAVADDRELAARRRVGVASMSAPLRRVAVRRPGALLTADHRRWHYRHPVDATRVVEEHARFVEALDAHGVEVLWFDPDDAGADDPVRDPTTTRGADDDLADSVFTYDPSFVVPTGAVLLRPGKVLRRDEVALHAAFYDRTGIPVVGRIEAPATVEGGDLCWLDESTLAAGRGFRTDDHGIAQLRALLEPGGIEVVAYDLPYADGPEACLHLLSIVNPLDTDLALVNRPLLPVALHRYLLDRGWTLLDAPPDELHRTGGLSLNVLATGPRRGIAVDGCPETLAVLQSAGCEITTFPGAELCVNAEGGPTCLSRPLRRG